MHEHPGQELERVHGLRARGRAFRLVGALGLGLGGPVVRQPSERHGIPRAVPGESGGEGAIVLRDPHGGVHVEPGVWPRQHPGGLVLVEQLEAHEEPEHGAAERLRQPRRVMGWP